MSIISFVSLSVSILGVFIYSSLFSGSGLIFPFVIVSVISIILPAISKKIRLVKGKKGKILEIIAIIIGGYNFYCVFFALTKLPLIIAYSGWVISGIAYKITK